MAKHWTQTAKGKAFFAERRQQHDSEPQDRLPLLYALPGIEMAATVLIERINTIRALLGQPPWSIPKPSSPLALAAVQPTMPTREGGGHSLKARKNMALAQRRRWARIRAEQEAAEQQEPEPQPKKRILTVKQLRAMRRNAVKARAAQAAMAKKAKASAA
jgi:hypothetical protein